MPTFLRDGLVTVFVFFVFVTLYLILNNLGYPSFIIWGFVAFNGFLAGISLFLAIQAGEKSVKETGHEAPVFWVVALGMFILVAVMLHFVFLLENNITTPATIGVAGTLTTITVVYFMMSKEMYETKVGTKL